MIHFGWIDYTVAAVYLTTLVIVGSLFVKGQHSINDFFLAGRSMGGLVVAISILAAFFSGISYLGAPAEVYKNGLAFFWVMLAFFIATPFTTLFLMPFFYRARFLTAYHYLEERFSLPVRLLASGLFILRVSLWLGGAVYAPALALKQATGLPLWISILATGILTTFYTTLGGMKAVIWTDVIQFFVLFGGQALIVVAALVKIPGGWSEIAQVAAANGQPLPLATLDPSVRITWPGVLLAAALLLLVQMATDQVAVQRYMTARDLRTARRALWLKLAATLPVLALFYGTGVVLRAFYNHAPDPLATKLISSADQILPYFVVNELPCGLPGVLIAAILGASMSTCSAGLNSLASATMVDFQQRLSRGPKSSDAQQLRQARLWTVAYGALVIGLAYVVSRLGTLVEATNTIIGMIGGPLLGLFITGIFIKRVNASAALCGCVVGFAACIVTKLCTETSFLWFTFIGTAVTCLVAWLLSFLWRSAQAKDLRGLVWDNSMLANEEVKDRR